MIEDDAILIGYDFETRTGNVVFSGDYKLVIKEVVDWFEDASEGTVMVIHATVGNLQVVMARVGDKWSVMAGPNKWS